MSTCVNIPFSNWTWCCNCFPTIVIDRRSSRVTNYRMTGNFRLVLIFGFFLSACPAGRKFTPSRNFQLLVSKCKGQGVNACKACDVLEPSLPSHSGHLADSIGPENIKPLICEFQVCKRSRMLVYSGESLGTRLCSRVGKLKPPNFILSHFLKILFCRQKLPAIRYFTVWSTG